MLYIMQVCILSIDWLVLSHFLVVCAFGHSMVDLLVVFLFVLLYWYAFTYRSFVYGAVSWCLGVV
jgi:hypothetical protein